MSAKAMDMEEYTADEYAPDDVLRPDPAHPEGLSVYTQEGLGQIAEYLGKPPEAALGGLATAAVLSGVETIADVETVDAAGDLNPSPTAPLEDILIETNLNTDEQATKDDEMERKMRKILHVSAMMSQLVLYENMQAIHGVPAGSPDKLRFAGAG